MWSVTFYLTRYLEWHLARAEKLPRWVGHAVNALVTLGLVLAIYFTPNWFVLLCLFLSVVFAVPFVFAAQQVSQRREEQRRRELEQMEGAIKTRKLIDNGRTSRRRWW
ncbi:MAG: hypothetical protein AB3N21_18505 [Ruegeria sp.]|uniref:hypothetical protein n=1 Tax=Ruegeria sp. TaxID=1879320 RepID=UPI00349ECBDF